ncbi:LysR family transcriptional regulator [Anditalea andensis]|uniref:LysR family transcriptional regulator n=1 Tax=Anditalea andensis TaxID=1048983 RepID=A0A074LIX2_9BACT|nr:LysR family transcriptional regulator [Anditalea andensis]KEO73747.1 LysR family transcriptional regulator [Anditalea andensis]
MELQQIKYFLALAQELHFWNTAEKIFITQSALSRQIKALEDELGLKLFERTKRSVKLTAAGAFLRDKWELMLDEIDLIHRQAKKLQDGESGSIRIGYAGSIAYGFLPDLIASISAHFPELKVDLVEPIDISTEKQLLNYQMDLAFRREPAGNPALQSVCLYSENISLVVPENHHLNEENFGSILDVKDEKFILSGLHHQTYYVASLRQMFNECGMEPNVHIESDFGGMILSLVSKGLGISILPHSYAINNLQGVRFIRLPTLVSLYVTWRKDDPSAVLKNILRQVEQISFNYKQ